MRYATTALDKLAANWQTLFGQKGHKKKYYAMAFGIKAATLMMFRLTKEKS